MTRSMRAYNSLVLVFGQILGLMSSLWHSDKTMLHVSTAIQRPIYVEDEITFSQWAMHVLYISANGILSGAIISTALFMLGIAAVRLGFKDKIKRVINNWLDRYDPRDKTES